MPGHKNERTAEDIRREIIATMKEIKDPRVAERMLTVVRVNVSSDCSYAKVYVSDLQGIDGAKEACKVLNNVQGLFRKEVGRKLHLRKAPELKFIADDSVEYGMKIFKELDELNRKESGNE